MEYIILYWILFTQLVICAWTAWFIYHIGSFFPAEKRSYQLKPNNDNRYTIVAGYPKKGFKDLLASINDYLLSYYRASKAPPLSQLEAIAANHSKKYDAIASLFASFPILIGLGGTIVGLIYAFSNVHGELLESVSASAKIVFIGSLSGILASLLLNAFIAFKRVKRNERLNILMQFVHTELSPVLPSLTDETMKTVSGQLDIFSQVFFSRFQTFAEEFQKMAEAIRDIHDTGLKGIIEKNSGIMAKLTENIDKLETLHETTSAIRFDPQVFKLFMEKSTALTESNHDVLKNMETYNGLFKEVNNSFKYLYNKVEDGVVGLGQDRDIITNLHGAMSNFAKTTLERTENMNGFVQSFNTQIKTLFENYHHSLHEVSDALLKNIENNLNTEDYKGILQNLVQLSTTFEQESKNIQALSVTVGNLTTELGEKVIPSLDGLEQQVTLLSGTIEYKIPAAYEQALVKNQEMTEDIIKRTFRRPRSWGEWSFQGIRSFLRRFQSKA